MGVSTKYSYRLQVRPTKFSSRWVCARNSTLSRSRSGSYVLRTKESQLLRSLQSTAASSKRLAVKERFICSQDEGKSAFEELAVYCCQLEEALCEKKELAKTKILALKECNCHQREKLERLRAKYCALLELYNKFAEECEKDCKDRSDSSCSEDEEDCEGWCSQNLD